MQVTKVKMKDNETDNNTEYVKNAFANRFAKLLY
ncbi:Uncharacterised protein [Providencia rettgeri]|uniref:Uncharacterized protein n=1 Tax=Providencia rettgeri TaxID=587 RepID=A0A9N8D1E3_PRORE|nr:hypothetical protein [Providencia rettgeri]CAB5551826.1 Uncharacterised protein [Providencia rettgeri]CAB5659444.1 Uncharacterised protein [Providencia rettgeri]CAB5665199.1 Uncharacterised protein [Providencia rettgeri]CAC9153792.1 Uncharacterised protein [Providencia rettgeri]